MKVSKGERDSVSWKVTKMIRRERSDADRHMFIFDAWKKGKNPWITIANPNTMERNKKFIRVRTNSIWGNPKKKNSSELVTDV
jgi:hypothetical protein